jgi:alpha-L-arabinofuranosidase
MWARAYGAIQAWEAAAVTTTAVGDVVDLATYADLAKREIKMVIMNGNFTTVTTATFAATECETTGGAYTACLHGTTSAVVTNTTGNITELNFRANYRYVKLAVSFNTDGSIPIAACVLAMKREANS